MYKENSTNRIVADWDEGTFTPNLRHGTSTADFTFTGRTGVWSRIGALVNVAIHITWTGNITGHTGEALNIDNMPFKKNTNFTNLTMSVGAWSQFTASGTTQMAARFSDNTTQINFIWCNSVGSDAGSVVAQQADSTGLKFITASFTYPTHDLLPT